MAEPAAGSSGSGKGFSKVVQKTVFRTKEKVLQNLGKADKTRDDTLDQSLELFNEQQNVSTKLQKEVKRYAASVKVMCLASQDMYRTLKECYEENWSGHDDVASAVEHHAILWDEHAKTVTELQNFVASYAGQFPEMRAKIAKRGRKLTDYDGARHTHDALISAKKRDEGKISKALDELNDAKSVYETINADLHEELPALYNRRVGFLASLFDQLISSEVLFQEESVKLKNTMREITQRLSEEDNMPSGHEVKPRKSLPDSGARAATKSSYSEGAAKLNNFERHYQSHYEANPTNSKQSNLVKARHSYEAQVSSSSQTKSSASSHEDSQIAESKPLPSSNSRVTNTKLPNASTPAKAKSLDDSDVDDDDDFEHLRSGAATSSAQQDSAIYSFVTACDESDEYAVPKSNAPINRPSVEPRDQVLFRVQATHAYVGEDIDELTFEPGDIISVIPFDIPEEQDDGWLLGIRESTQERGVFPENFTKRM